MRRGVRGAGRSVNAWAPRLLLCVVVAGVTAGAAAPTSAAGDPAPAAGAWTWPLAGPRVVVRPFDPPATRYSAGHRGADIGAAAGAVVRAAGAGRVAYAGLLAGRGVVVVVHGELRTTYEPVAASVRVGEHVAMGGRLGVLAAGGHCAGCLHWGLLRGDEYLDPVRLVRRGPSRLLPVPDVATVLGGAPAAAVARRVARVSPEAAPPLPAEPSFSLRAAEAPWGAGAVFAFVLGLLLLRRPKRQPPSPEPPQAAAGALPIPASPRPADAAAPGARGMDGVVDLARERTLRRHA